jgi:hypothetical protein
MEIFNKYPDISINADMIDDNYRVTYTEVVEDFGRYFFVKKQVKLSKHQIERMVERILEECENKKQ